MNNLKIARNIGRDYVWWFLKNSYIYLKPLLLEEAFLKLPELGHFIFITSRALILVNNPVPQYYSVMAAMNLTCIMWHCCVTAPLS